MDAGGIALVPTESFNLTILAPPDRARVDVAPGRVNHQWFAGTFTGLPVDGATTIRLCMTGHDIGVNIADCRKWVGLRPLMTYGDPTTYDCYVWYARDAQGRWVSRDLFLPGTARHAGDGPVPAQSVIPAELADQFLSEDGTRWSPWREMAAGEVDTAARTFTLRERFARSRATVAMHIPYTVAYQYAFLDRLRAAALPGISVDHLGHSAAGRPLYMIRVDDPEHPTPLRMGETTRADGSTVPLVRIDDPPHGLRPRVLLILAREHGSEHQPSWLVQGLLRQLTANTVAGRRMRRRTTWLLLPMYDPDGAADSVFHAITSRFFPHKDHPIYGDITPPEVIAYARYLRAFVNSGRLLANVTAFYGLECGEGNPVLCPFVIRQERELLLDFNAFWFSRLQRLGIPTNDPRAPWFEGWVPHRLHGWCWYSYGAFTTVFQIGDRYPDSRLDLPGLEHLGAHYGRMLVQFLETARGQRRLQETQRFLDNRATERDLWFRTSMAGTPDVPSLHDLLSMGY